MVITSRSSGARNLIRMHPCAWYLVIPGTTRTDIVRASALAVGSGSRSFAEAASADVVLAGLELAGLAPARVALPPSVTVGLPEPAGASLGTVVSVGLRP